jgi:small conductance mechanosensitive channel
VRARDEVEAGELAQRAETIRIVAGWAGSVVIFVAAILMILIELGLDVTPALASVGLLGLALGLGAQTLVKDIIGGLFILIEDQFAIGDAIRVGGVSGTVERMTLRSTHLRGLNGELHVMPNGDIRTVSNLSRDWSRAVLDVPLSGDEDVARAMQVLEQVGQELAADEQVRPLLLEEPKVTGVEGLDGLTVRVRIMVRTLPGQQWDVMRDLRQRVVKAYAAEGLRLGVRIQDILGRG